jgi:hypothetical protein
LTASKAVITCAIRLHEELQFSGIDEQHGVIEEMLPGSVYHVEVLHPSGPL